MGFFQCKFEGINGIWSKLGLVDGVVLGTPEIMFYLDCGITVYIGLGAYSTGVYNGLNFNDKVIENKWYQKFIGCLDMKCDRESWKIKGNSVFAGLLKGLGYETYYNDGIITVSREITKKKTYCHIASYIQMYSRIRVLERVRDMKPEDVMAIKTDAILYKGEYEIVDGWRSEKVKCVDGLGDSLYTKCDSVFGASKWFDGCDNKKMFISGFGGSGKTHDRLTDAGYLDIAYSATCWARCCDAIEKYSVKGFSIAMLTGSGCKPLYNEIDHEIGWLVIDEATMINAGSIGYINELYGKHTGIIVIGDIDKDGRPFQCCGVDWKCYDYIGNGFRFVEGSGIDYRARDCLKLQEIKGILRNYNKEFYNGEMGLIELIQKQIDLLVSTIGISSIDDYNHLTDIIIVSTNKLKAFYTDKFKHLEKYRVVDHRRSDVFKRIRTGQGLVNGMIVFESSDVAELCHAVTIHSVQGNTCEGNVYIDINKIFDVNQLYTAVSRARRIDQIKLIK